MLTRESEHQSDADKILLYDRPLAQRFLLTLSLFIQVYRKRETPYIQSLSYIIHLSRSPCCRDVV